VTRFDESELGERRGLPVTEFLYTLDQIAHVLGMSASSLPLAVHFEGLIGRKQGPFSEKKMRAINIIPWELLDAPEWRVQESELIRYMADRKLVIYERRFR